jgi:hypothetical protein
MGQRPENFNPAGEDPEATLVTPRFDETEARHAHPVVPLEEAPARGRRARAPRRSWANVLPVVALLVVAALGGAAATKFMQSPRAERVQEAGQAQEQAQPAPVQAAEAPPPPSQPPAPQVSEASREQAPAAKPETRETHTRPARTAAPAPVAVERVEVDDDDDDGEARGKSSERRRGREDDVEKELRKAAKRAKGKAPRLVDVLTSPEQ